MKKSFLQYGISCGVCAAMVVFYCAVREFTGMEQAERLRTLSDAFTVPGILGLGSGILLRIANEGIFCGLGYCMRFVRKAFIPGTGQKTGTYLDYVLQHREKKRMGYGFLPIVGSLCMGAAIVFLILFYKTV